MSNDMKLIMENWRKFSTSQEMYNVATDILIETKIYNNSLSVLISEHENKKISTKKYITIIQESIDKDFKDLDSLLNDKKVLSELAAFDSIKKVAKSAADSVVQKINSIFIKALSMIKVNAKSAILTIEKTKKYLDNFAKRNPELTKKFLSALKVAAMLAIAYVVLNPGEAHAYIDLPATSARGATTLGSDTESGKMVINFLTNNAQHVMDILGIKSNYIDLIIKAINSKDPVKVGQSVINILQQIRAMAERTEFMDSFKPLIDNAANTATQIAHSANAAMDAANSSISQLKTLSSPEQAKEAVQQYLNDNPGLKDGNSFGLNPANIIKHALKDKLSASDFKSPAFNAAKSSIEMALRGFK